MRYLLDTCVVSEPLRKRPAKKVLEWLGAQEERILHLSVVTLGEVHKGILKLPDGRKRRELEEWVDRDLRGRFSGRLLAFDQEIALQWGQLAAEAEVEGRPVPVLDGLLGATALAHGLTFVTRNTAHLTGTAVKLLNPWDA